MLVRTLISGRGGGNPLARSPWRLTLGLAALIAAAALAILSLSGPVAADAHQPDVLFGSCEESSEPVCTEVTAPGPDINVKGLRAIQVSSGTSHALALTRGGEIQCWGETDAVEDLLCQLPDLTVQRGNNVRAGNDDPAVVVLDAHGRPAIDETGQQSAESNRYLVDQEDVRWSQVAAGNLHSCGITTEGEVYCWGSSRVLPAIQIPMGILARQADGEIPDPRFYKVVVGDAHTCVLEHEANVDTATGAVNMGNTEIRGDMVAAGSIVCWGDNSYGQTNVPGDPHPAHRAPLPSDPNAGLGGEAVSPNGDIGDSDSDGAPESMYMYVDVTAGANHTCAVRTSGIVDCWGSKSHGQINVPMQLRLVRAQEPQQAVIGPDGMLTTLARARTGRFHSIEAGENYTCAINAEGGALCWGANIGANPSRAETLSDAGAGGTGSVAVTSLGFGAGYAAGQEYPPAGEYTQISAGRWHACALHTWDDFPMRAENPSAPEPAVVQTVDSSGRPIEPALQITLSDGTPANLDCWGNDAGPDGSGGLMPTGRAFPPTQVVRMTDQGELKGLSPLSWNQISAGGTFSCGIFDLGVGVGSPVPSSSTAADRGLFSATAAVEEGAVACWGLVGDEDVPAPDTIYTGAGPDVTITVCEPTVTGGTAVIPPSGWGKIRGHVSDDGSLRLAFTVIQKGPDFWIEPEFNQIPPDGNMTVGRWYYSDLMTVPRYADSGTAAPLDESGCDYTNMPVGRIAVRLLPTGHWELALMTADGAVMANVPRNHNRVPTPAEPSKWWSTDWIKWYDAR